MGKGIRIFPVLFTSPLIILQAAVTVDQGNLREASALEEVQA